MLRRHPGEFRLRGCQDLLTDGSRPEDVHGAASLALLRTQPSSRGWLHADVCGHKTAPGTQAKKQQRSGQRASGRRAWKAARAPPARTCLCVMTSAATGHGTLCSQEPRVAAVAWAGAAWCRRLPSPSSCSWAAQAAGEGPGEALAGRAAGRMSRGPTLFGQQWVMRESILFPPGRWGETPASVAAPGLYPHAFGRFQGREERGCQNLSVPKAAAP